MVSFFLIDPTAMLLASRIFFSTISSFCLKIATALPRSSSGTKVRHSFVTSSKNWANIFVASALERAVSNICSQMRWNLGPWDQRPIYYFAIGRTCIKDTLLMKQS
ncbi:hypothetical protein BJX70DRAFT_360935 [Aspergillus crustosus]